MRFLKSRFLTPLAAPLIAGLVAGAPLSVPVGIGLMALPEAALAKTQKTKPAKKSALPKPYVSKALRAVLMPVTKAVAKKFHLPKGSKGVMVVSVQKDGLGKLAGIKPGDVINSLLGYQVKKPSDVDTIIAWLLTQGTQDYKIGGIRKNGRSYATQAYITYDYFWAPFDVYTVSDWTSFTYGAYSYEEYYSYYSEEIYTSYERSETYINQTITNQTFITNVTNTSTEIDYAAYDEQIVDGSYVSGGEGEVWADDATLAYSTADDPVEYEVADAASFDPEAESFAAAPGDADYAEVTEEEAAALGEDEAALYDAPAAGEAAPEDMASDEALTEDAPTDETATDEAATEEPTYDEGATDETATEEPTYDEGATDEAMTGDTGEVAPDEGYTEEAPPEDQSYQDQGGGESQCPDGTWLGSDGTCTSGESAPAESYDQSGGDYSGDSGSYDSSSDGGSYDSSGDAGSEEQY